MIWWFSLILGFGIYFLMGRLSKEKKTAPSSNLRPWHSRYTSLTKNFDPKQVEVFYKNICKLAKRYRPPANLSLYFRAYQFTAKHSSFYSLLLYLHYFYAYTSFAADSPVKISDNFKKILFRNKMQETRFLQICTRLKENRNPAQAIEDTKLLFRITRREIRLDAPEIEETSRKQLQTVELLRKYLADDTETLPETVATVVSSANNVENVLFGLFKEKKFVLSKTEIDTFAQKNNVFCNSLIQQINETYYEAVDDVLIEDEGDIYTLNQKYYEQIKECL
jgi:hypothetical protein